MSTEAPGLFPGITGTVGIAPHEGATLRGTCTIGRYAWVAVGGRPAGTTGSGADLGLLVRRLCSAIDCVPGLLNGV